MTREKKKLQRRQRRHRRLRRRAEGTAGKPRLAVFRSLQHIYCQLIDDESGRTLASSSTVEKDVRGKMKDDASKLDGAAIVGEEIARKAKAEGVEAVVFDRGGFRFHGRVKALAEGARKGGLKF